MLVHSFNKLEEKDDEGFLDYYQFLKLFGKQGKMNSLVFAKNIDGVTISSSVESERWTIDSTKRLT